MNETAALSLEGVACGYGTHLVLQDVTLALDAGSFSVVLGNNGAGKSTLVGLIAGLFVPAQGELRLFGIALADTRAVDRAGRSVVFQQSSLDLDLTVMENIAYHAALYGLPLETARARGREELERLGLAERCNDRVRTLSGGLRRRAELARALVHSPKLLVLDEPTAGLDPAARQFVNDYARALCHTRGLAVLWTTHLTEEIRPGDRAFRLEDGVLVEQKLALDNAGPLASHQSGPLGNVAPNYARAFWGILQRETLRAARQHARLAATIVRPLVWLAIFAAGFRSVLGVSIMPPYETYVLYEVYIVPGLAAMMLLFHGMQTSLAMVYDREMGSMRTLLASPLPRWYLLGARVFADLIVVLPLIYGFLVLARAWDVRPPGGGYLAVLPALVLAGLMLGAFGLLLSSMVRHLENFAGVMNFVIFPMFFASTALYPLWRFDEVSPWLAAAARLNPFSYAVELIRFSLYERLDPLSAGIVGALFVIFFAAAAYAYDPVRWNRQARR